jgi:hypothetical protein
MVMIGAATMDLIDLTIVNVALRRPAGRRCSRSPCRRRR